MATWMDALAASLQGYAAGQDAKRQRELQDQALARQQQALERQQAEAAFKQLQGVAQNRLASNDRAGAAAVLPQLFDQQNKAYGLNLAGPKFIPGQNGAPDWGNAANVTALNAAAGYTPPKPLEVTAGASLFDPTNGKLLATAPNQLGEARVQAQLEALQLRERLGLAGYDLRRDLAGQAEAGRDRRFDAGQAGQNDRQAARLDAAAANAGAKSFDGLVGDFEGAFPGVAITSLYRSPEQNATIPGAAPNGHDGYQFDTAIPPAALQPQVRAWAAANGLELIDKPHGSGPHWHFQVPKGQRPTWSPTRQAARTRRSGSKAFDPIAFEKKVEDLVRKRYPETKREQLGGADPAAARVRDAYRKELMARAPQAGGGAGTAPAAQQSALGALVQAMEAEKAARRR